MVIKRSIMKMNKYIMRNQMSKIQINIMTNNITIIEIEEAEQI